MKKIIVIPTYNEAENIALLLNEIFAKNPDFNIIIVDDNSPDGTGEIADEISKKDNRIHVLHRPAKAGLGTAYVEGFKEALKLEADLIFEMDADFSHNPVYLKDFVEASEKFDLVIGSRYVNGVRVEGWKFRRLLLSKFANIFVSYMLVRPIWDFTTGFRCYRRKVLEAIDLDSVKSDGYAFQIEMLHLAFKHGFKVYEVPIVFKERFKGFSKISKNVVREAFWLTLKFRAPLSKIIKHSSYLFKDYNEFIEEYYKEIEKNG
ncbi:MAG: polyprenol monophosphomannose synthase [Candidatus Omnitrophica bacterium]|nr:polyprenol monophosphomannose synthase [Candidatus Omnitrophota bacterium]